MSFSLKRQRRRELARQILHLMRKFDYEKHRDSLVENNIDLERESCGRSPASVNNEKLRATVKANLSQRVRLSLFSFGLR